MCRVLKKEVSNTCSVEEHVFIIYGYALSKKHVKTKRSILDLSLCRHRAGWVVCDATIGLKCSQDLVKTLSFLLASMRWCNKLVTHKD